MTKFGNADSFYLGLYEEVFLNRAFAIPREIISYFIITYIFQIVEYGFVSSKLFNNLYAKLIKGAFEFCERAFWSDRPVDERQWVNPSSN